MSTLNTLPLSDYLFGWSECAVHESMFSTLLFKLNVNSLYVSVYMYTHVYV